MALTGMGANTASTLLFLTKGRRKAVFSRIREHALAAR